ncbi:hypothetical protein [Cupriavidus basilensis]|uniref:hypothetical protein n=1 Tax=Cupriavidus basilensis TaxID=68895 RepID=UPI0005BD98B9|nr:hypothetical protein [Cupriavidus basilensis]
MSKMSRLMRFASSQKNVDRVAFWGGVIVGIYFVFVVGAMTLRLPRLGTRERAGKLDTYGSY